MRMQALKGFAVAAFARVAGSVLCVGKATAHNYQGRLCLSLSCLGESLLGPELHLYLPGPCYLYR